MNLKNFRRRFALAISPELKSELENTQKSRVVVRDALSSAKPYCLRIDPKYPDAEKRYISTFKRHLLQLCAAIEGYENITHWAISNRIFGRGSYFRDLRDKPRGDVKGAAYEKAMNAFDEMWPADLEWPADIPRPIKKEDAA